MRESLYIHIGQAGVQIGDALWELLSLEHNVDENGASGSEQSEALSRDCLFQDVRGRQVPRAFFIDSDHETIDKLRNGPRRELYNPSLLISGSESAADVFARGYHCVKNELLELSYDRIRKQVEKCSSFQGFIVTRAIGGGTGSGFGAALVEKLNQEFKSRPIIENLVFPSPNISNSTVEAYNGILSTNACMPHVDCSLVFDNEACYKLLPKQGANTTGLNQLLAQALSASTIGWRASADVSLDVRDLSTNLVPFQRMHYCTVNFGPVVDAKSFGAHGTLRGFHSVTEDLFKNKASLASCNLTEGRYFSSCILYRGTCPEFSERRMATTLASMKEIKFVDWRPAAFKLARDSCAPKYAPNSPFGEVPHSVCMLASNTAVRSLFTQMLRKFAMLYSKKAFVHSYLAEGLEVSELEEAFFNVRALEKEYIMQSQEVPINAEV